MPDSGGPAAIPAGLTAADAMTRGLLSAEPATPLAELVARMARAGRRAIPIVDGGFPVGIVTQHDLVVRGGAGVRLDLLGTLEGAEQAALLAEVSRTGRVAADVMTPDPVTVTVSTPLRAAAETMARRRLKRLPVVDGEGRLAGMLARVDVLRAAAGGGAEPSDAHPAAGFDSTAPVSSVMRRDVPVVPPDAPLAEVFRAVVSTRLDRALVVGADRHVLGLVSDAELLVRLAPPLRQGVFSALVQRLPFANAERAAMERQATARTAQEIMVPAPTAPPELPLSLAIPLVLHGAHKLLAIVDADGALLGVLDRADILRGVLLPPR